MICTSCREAADEVAEAKTEEQAATAGKKHDACDHCDCQHDWKKQWRQRD